MSETGTATLGMSVARGLRRKMKTTSTTRQTDPISVLLHGIDRSPNGRGAVQNDVVLMPCGQHRLEKRQLRFDAVDGLNDVGARLAEDDDEDARVPSM
jgi:hypothetical protein